MIFSDGRYDVLVVDAEAGESGSVRLELVITIGPEKGQVVAVDMSGGLDPNIDPLSFLGLPGTLVVSGGTPTFSLDD